MSAECVQVKRREKLQPPVSTKVRVNVASSHELLRMWRSTSRRYRTARHNWRDLLNHYVKP